MWRYVTALSPGLVRDEPDSWYPSEAGGADPWPHSGWKSFSDMFQASPNRRSPTSILALAPAPAPALTRTRTCSRRTRLAGYSASCARRLGLGLGLGFANP